MAEHVHDCTTPDGRCQCGFTFTVPRFAVSIEVYDNATKQTLVSEAFNTDSLSSAVMACEDAISVLERQAGTVVQALRIP